MSMRPILWLGAAASLILAIPATAQMQIFSREQDVVDLRLGQRVQIDDGSCPTGQIKQLTGTTLTPAGVSRAKACVPRLGTKKK